MHQALVARVREMDTHDGHQARLVEREKGVFSSRHRSVWDLIVA